MLGAESAAIALLVGTLSIVRVGSKMDTEGNVLAELFAQLIEHAGEARVERAPSLGGTSIVLAALDSGHIDVYPEYSGVLMHFILHRPEFTDFATVARETQARGYLVSAPLGFDNSYAFGMRADRAAQLGIHRVSDLLRFPQLRLGLSPEFYSSEFGWPAAQRTYGLTFAEVRSVTHALAYDALTHDAIDITDLYTTDATIRTLRLVALEDDRGAFPHYYGLALARSGFERRYPRSWAALQSLAGRLTQDKMIALNRQSEVDRRPFGDIARAALADFGLVAATHNSGASGSEGSIRRLAEAWKRLWPLTLEHLWLVFVSLFASIIVSVPLGILAARSRALGHVLVSASGVVQTIPSVALLCFLIPVLGIGAIPAVVALFLYGLFPIVRGTVTGLASVDARLLDVAYVLGMTRRQRLLRVELPLASVAILNGIKVTAVTNVGTATLAALIGGGGYGTLIVTGLGINDPSLVLAGAVPSAVLALIVHAGFELLDRVLVPAGLRVGSRK